MTKRKVAGKTVKKNTIKKGQVSKQAPKKSAKTVAKKVAKKAVSKAPVRAAVKPKKVVVAPKKAPVKVSKKVVVAPAPKVKVAPKPVAKAIPVKAVKPVKPVPAKKNLTHAPLVRASGAKSQLDEDAMKRYELERQADEFLKNARAAAKPKGKAAPLADLIAPAKGSAAKVAPKTSTHASRAAVLKKASSTLKAAQAKKATAEVEAPQVSLKDIEKQVEQLLERGRTEGVLTYEEIASFNHKNRLSDDDANDLLRLLDKENIDLILQEDMDGEVDYSASSEEAKGQQFSGFKPDIESSIESFDVTEEEAEEDDEEEGDKELERVKTLTEPSQLNDPDRKSVV